MTKTRMMRRVSHSLWGRVSVERITPVQDAGNLRALATVRVGPITIHGFRVVQQTRQRAWVSVPQRQDKEGNYWPQVSLDEELKDRVRSVVLEEWSKFDA
jgi:DNA-binding cell septation regulator SpoVG